MACVKGILCDGGSGVCEGEKRVTEEKTKRQIREREKRLRELGFQRGEGDFRFRVRQMNEGSTERGLEERHGCEGHWLRQIRMKAMKAMNGLGR